MNGTGPSLEGDDRASILIVDDRPENLLALEQILDPLGQDITTATSGADALRCLLHRDYAVILLDVQMPGMDGLETAMRIKQRERCRHIPIIFLTAVSVDRHDAFDGYSAGAVDYLSRPFEPWLLRSKVAVFLDVHLERQRAARLSAELSRAQLRRRHAIELNDTVVQGLAVAKYALELGRPEQARAAVEDTLEAAKRVIGDLLLDEQVGPGDLVRMTPSRQTTAHHEGL
jgi:CheY-like chemotaxis protein